METPVELIKEYEEAGFLFPLVIKRQEITNEFLSPYMRERFVEESAKIDRQTVIQSYNGTQILAFTPIIQFWLSRGMRISNVTKFYQFVPGKALKPFADKVYNMRCQATYEKDESKGNTAKIFGNSGKFRRYIQYLVYCLGYGKCGEDVSRHVRTVVVTEEEKLMKLVAKPLFESEQARIENNIYATYRIASIHKEFYDEFKNLTAWEVKMKKRRIDDNKPVIFSVAILQHSKLLFMRYVVKSNFI